MAPEMLPDTIKGEITYMKHDSINNLVEATDKLRLAWVYVESEEERRAREDQERERERAERAGEEWVEPEKENTFKLNIPSSGEFNKDKALNLEFDYPLTKFDSAAITLTMTTEQITEPQPVDFHFIRDTLNSRKYRLDVKWEPNGKYELTMPAGVFENIARETNDTIKCSYTASDPSRYAIVNINVQSTRADMHYILQLTNVQGKVLKEIRNATAGKYVMEYVAPGDVMLRVIEDGNGNGKWDSGDMVLMRQPERSEIYKNDEGVETITTKENWEFDLDVDMDQLFAPVTMESLVQMLNDREDERLKKLAEEEAKRRRENAGKQNGNQGSSSGMGFGGMGNMGGMGGLGGSTGGIRSSSTGSMGTTSGTGSMRQR
jgi:uncharacterized membrane protein YgcG